MGKNGREQNTNKLDLEHPDINNTDSFIQVLASSVKGKLQLEHSELNCDCTIIALHCKHTNLQTRAHKQQRICKYLAAQRSSLLQTNVPANDQLQFAFRKSAVAQMSPPTRLRVQNNESEIFVSI